MIRVLVFDWGDTLMRDFPEYTGPMAFWPSIELMPNVKESLNAVSKKYTCCVASNAGASDEILMGKALERAGIEKFFNFRFTSKELGFKKPEPQFYSEIVKRAGFKAEEHIMIGNDYSKDIIPAKEIGMKTILISKESTFETFECADFIIDNMLQLEGILSECGDI